MWYLSEMHLYGQGVSEIPPVEMNIWVRKDHSIGSREIVSNVCSPHQNTDLSIGARKLSRFNTLLLLPRTAIYSARRGSSLAGQWWQRDLSDPVTFLYVPAGHSWRRITETIRDLEYMIQRSLFNGSSWLQFDRYINIKSGGVPITSIFYRWCTSSNELYTWLNWNEGKAHHDNNSSIHHTGTSPNNSVISLISILHWKHCFEYHFPL